MYVSFLLMILSFSSCGKNENITSNQSILGAIIQEENLEADSLFVSQSGEWHNLMINPVVNEIHNIDSIAFHNYYLSNRDRFWETTGLRLLNTFKSSVPSLSFFNPIKDYKTRYFGGMYSTFWLFEDKDITVEELKNIIQHKLDINTNDTFYSNKTNLIIDLMLQTGYKNKIILEIQNSYKNETYNELQKIYTNFVGSFAISVREFWSGPRVNDRLYPDFTGSGYIPVLDAENEDSEISSVLGWVALLDLAGAIMSAAEDIEKWIDQVKKPTKEEIVYHVLEGA